MLKCIRLAAALGLTVVLGGLFAPSTEARLVLPRTSSQLIDLHRQLDSVNASTPTQLDAALEGYIRAGLFPKAGRTLEMKIREADEFLAREMNRGAAGVGIAAAVVYKDEVALSKGYGLRHSDDSVSNITSSTLFQIGSVTKTFIALGIAILIDDGKLAWKDPVIKHLRTLQLFDKYAQQHVTIGDLLAMNSGLGRMHDVAWGVGHFASDKDFVDAIGDAEPAHSLRSEYDYANVNFAILGQVIERVTDLEWDAFLQQRIWTPLKMTRTFGDAAVAQADTNVASGHQVCDDAVLGPFNLVTSPEAQLIAGTRGVKTAAGSILSTADDMATLMRLMLNKGRVGNKTIIHSPKLVTQMVSGQSILSDQVAGFFNLMGHHLTPEGSPLAAGYGIDAVSHAMWGHAYYDKGGDTVVHKTRTGFIPNDDVLLGVTLLVNSEFVGSRSTVHIDHMRSYVIGIFLDVPTELLELSLVKWQTAVSQLPKPRSIVPTCGAMFWTNPPDLPLSPKDAHALAGVYAPAHSVKYYGLVTVTATAAAANRLEMQAGEVVGKLQLVADTDIEKLFVLMTPSGKQDLTFRKNAETGKYDIDMGGMVFQHA